MSYLVLAPIGLGLAVVGYYVFQRWDLLIISLVLVGLGFGCGVALMAAGLGLTG